MIMIPFHNDSAESWTLLFEPWAFVLNLEKGQRADLYVLQVVEDQKPVGIGLRNGKLIIYPVDAEFSFLEVDGLRVFNFR
jgi:hypothetical protein